MRSGGAIPKAAFTGLLIAIAGCGSQNTAPKSGGNALGLQPQAAAGTAGAAGAMNAAGAAGTSFLFRGDGQTEYPDPSRLLEAYDSSASAGERRSAKPSNSGLKLEVLERGPGEAWILHLINEGDQPAELVADTRLLWFEVKLPDKKAGKQPPGKQKQSLCKLPESLAASSPPEPRLVVHLAPGEGVADQFDPRLYCFAEGDQKLLVPGAVIVPHFGWPEAPPKKRWKHGKLVEEPTLQKPPFVARQSVESHGGSDHSDRVSPKAAARLTSAGVSGADKELEGPSLTLRAEYAAWSHQGAPPPKSDESVEEPAVPPIGLRLVQGSDAKAEHEATVRLTVFHQSPLATYVYFRREMVSFEVAGPAGVTQCPGRLDDREPERSSFLHLTRGAKRDFDCRLAELCPHGTFGVPGLYLVYARFDATLSGHDQGIDAFVGPVYSRRPATVRIRTGEQPIFQKRPMTRIVERGTAAPAQPGTP